MSFMILTQLEPILHQHQSPCPLLQNIGLSELLVMVSKPFTRGGALSSAIKAVLQSQSRNNLLSADYFTFILCSVRLQATTMKAHIGFKNTEKLLTAFTSITAFMCTHK